MSAGEKAARAFLKPYHWIEPGWLKAGHFIVNREGHPREKRPEIQWLLRKGWVRRERSRAPSGVCANRQITRMVLTALGRRNLERAAGDGVPPERTE